MSIMKATRVSKRLLARAGWPQRADNGLSKLPIELFTEVAISLDWKDVPHLRQTCKHLSQITREKSIWIHFFRVSNLSHPWTPLPLERPLEFYTSEELENIVIRRTSLEMERKTSIELPLPMMRRLPINKSDIRALTLINGGRWLLVVSGSGSVSYYDLDAQEPVKRLLIPAARLESRDDHFPCTAKIAVDMNNESAFLSFNLALDICCRGHRFPHKIRSQLIQVWHVTLEFNDQHHRSRLSATFLSSFHRKDRDEFHDSLSLFGTFVAFGVTRPLEEPCCYVAIVDWAEATIHNPSHRRPRTLFSYPKKIIYESGIVRMIHLLSEDKILIASDFYIRLYDISSIQAKADVPATYPPAGFYLEPIWENSDFDFEILSEPYYCGNTNEFRLVFSTGYSVCGIIIPLCHIGAESQPEFVTFAYLNAPYGQARCHFGYNSAVVIDGVPPGPRLRMMDYSWPEESSQSSPGFSNSLVQFHKNYRRPQCSAFDEYSSRVVMEAGNKVVVYDFFKF